MPIDSLMEVICTCGSNYMIQEQISSNVIQHVSPIVPTNIMFSIAKKILNLSFKIVNLKENSKQQQK